MSKLGCRADHFVAAQHAVAVAIEPRELGGAAVPFGALDAAVVVPVHVVERVVAHVVDALAEEFLQADRVVAVGVDAAERLEIEVPLVGREPVVAVVIEAGEVGARPAEIALAAVRLVIGEIGVALRAGPHFVSRQHAVAVPVVILKRTRVAVPFFASDAAVVVVVQSLEPDFETGWA